MRLNQNMFSLNIYSNYKKNISTGETAMDRISSGLKINLAKDNPGKYSKNESLKIQVVTNSAARKNIQNTNSMLQTFDGAMQEINNCLSRMKELGVKSANEVLTDDDRLSVENEMEQLKSCIDDIAKDTEFNGVKLLCDDGTANKLTSIIGSIEGETIDIEKMHVTCDDLNLNSVDLSNANSSSSSITIITDAIKKVSSARSTYGAIQLRLEDTGTDLDKKSIALQNAQSRIGDADMAEEIVNYSTSQILMQSSISLMAQSNNFPLDALNILSNLR